MRDQYLTFMPGTPQEAYIEYDQNLDGDDRLLVFRYQAGPGGVFELAYGKSGVSHGGNSLCVPAFMNEQLSYFELMEPTDVTHEGATLNTRFVLDETPVPAISLWWASAGNDGGEVEGNWANGPVAAVENSGVWSATITGLGAAQNYVYRFSPDVAYAPVISSPRAGLAA